MYNIRVFQLMASALNQSSFEVEIKNSTAGVFTQHGNAFRYKLLLYSPDNKFQFLVS